MTTLQERPVSAEANSADKLDPAITDLDMPASEDTLALVDHPRIIGSKTFDERLSFWGCLVASAAGVWVCYFQLLPFSGLFGYLILWYLAFLGLYTLVSSEANPRPVVIDRLVSSVVGVGAGLVVFALGTTVVYTLAKGFPAIHHINFFTMDMSGVRPTDSLDHGGILHAIEGSAIELSIATAIALPLGIGTAVYMTEIGGRLARLVRVVVESMTALPDILAGLFIYTVLILGLGVAKSGFAAGLALAIMMMPIIARSTDVTLRLVSGGLREASLALGASRWRTVWNVVLPTARSGLATAVILGVARAIGETAPVLITSGASSFFRANPFHEPMNSLPLYIYAGITSGETNFVIRAYGAAFVLLVLVILLFVLTRYVARDRNRAPR